MLTRTLTCLNHEDLEHDCQHGTIYLPLSYINGDVLVVPYMRARVCVHTYSESTEREGKREGN